MPGAVESFHTLGEESSDGLGHVNNATYSVDWMQSIKP